MAGLTTAEARKAHARASRTHFSTRGPASRRGTTISFRLQRRAKIAFVVRGPAPSCRIIGVQTGHGRRGLNRIYFSGRLHGRPLAPGTYSIAIEAIRGRTRTLVGRLAVEVVPPRARLRTAQRIAPVADPCIARPPEVRLALIAAGVTTTSPPTGATPVTEPPRRGGTLGVATPDLPLDRLIPPSGAAGWVGILLLGVLFLGGTMLAVYVTRFFRGSWNP
jgi:hypothetical protein